MINHIIRNNFLIAIFFSIIFHLLFIYNFSFIKKEKNIRKYTVVNLASYKKFDEIIAEKKTEAKKEIREVKNLNEKKEVKEVKKIKKLPIKKEVITDFKKIVKKEVKSEEVQKITQKDITSEKVLKNEQNKTTSINRKAITKKINDNKVLKNKLLTKYLNLVSDEINLLANNIYPRQSIMRREQGKIITRVVIDSKGKILKVIDVTKRPKRLAKATKSLLLRKKNLLKPPEILFNDNKSITLEIPVNYVLD